ncbi:hypothetical protein PVK06_014357 [Gossypium arboreum]|uniref:Uncharacterized protein n=1 Tax=Gossypium arboreum TaxID=29729 RepID=A0ABR0PUC5_GOSAR|nr:hypothetical protein PVK06_014357 [Gossypium arboreum]
MSNANKNRHHRNTGIGMKQSKDTFEAALEEQEESPPDSPVGEDELNSQTLNEPPEPNRWWTQIACR